MPPCREQSNLGAGGSDYSWFQSEYEPLEISRQKRGREERKEIFDFFPSLSKDQAFQFFHITL